MRTSIFAGPRERHASTNSLEYSSSSATSSAPPTAMSQRRSVHHLTPTSRIPLSVRGRKARSAVLSVTSGLFRSGAFLGMNRFATSQHLYELIDPTSASVGTLRRFDAVQHRVSVGAVQVGEHPL